MEVTNNNYNASMKTKIAVLAGTAISSGAYIGHLIKRRGAGCTLKNISQLELGIKEGIGLCTASTVGGLVAGLAVDKPENRKAKLKDGVNQLIGNTLVPFGCLALANKCTKQLSKLSQALIAIGTLISTTFLGHRIANKTNEKIFKEDSGYKCSFKDFATDFDDIFFATSTVVKNKALYHITATICPITYMVHGYLAGCRQKDKKTLDKYI